MSIDLITSILDAGALPVTLAFVFLSIKVGTAFLSRKEDATMQFLEHVNEEHRKERERDHQQMILESRPFITADH